MATLNVGSDQPYKAIQDALNDAADGDTIIIAAGDYTAEGEIQINKALTVKAAEDAEVIVDHVVLGSSFNDPNVSAVTVSGLTIKPKAHNSGDGHYTGVWQNNINIGAITIENCVIDFSNTPDDVKSIGIKSSRGEVGDAVETLKITGNTIIGTDNTQSYITAGAKGSISSVTVEGNTCYGGSSSSAVTMDFGYKTTGEVSVVVKDNAIADVTNGHGINFGNVKNSDIDITVTGNTVENVTGEDRAAINMHNTSTEAGKVTVSDNVISDSIIGVNMSAVQGVVISDNTLTGCDESIIYTDGSVISGNTVNGEELTFPAYSGSDIFVYDKVTGEDGDKVIIDGIAYVVGVNAFASMDDATTAAGEAAKTADNVKVVVANGSNSSWSPYVFMTVGYSEEYFDKKAESGTYALDVNGTLSGACLIVNNNEMNVSQTGLLRLEELRTYGGTVTVNGSNTSGTVYGQNDLITDENGTPAGLGGTYYMTDKVQVKGCIIKINQGGVMNFNDTDVVLSCSGDQYALVGYNETAGTLNMDNSRFYLISTGGYGSSVSMSVATGSTFNITDSAINVLQDGVSAAINNAGTMNITGKVDIGAVINNEGTVNVTGESTLNIQNLTGNAIVLADGTTLKDSYVKGVAVETSNYTYALSVNGDEAGTVDFAGENTIQSLDAAAGDTVNVTDTLHFISDSDGFKLGNGATWNFEDATVDGAWYLSLDGAYMTDDENAPVSTLTATDSTFTLNQISAKGTRENQEIGYGKFNVKFEDSDVTLANRFQIQEQETAEINFNFTKSSTVSAKQFVNLSRKAEVTFDNSTATFTENFGNIGTVNVQNGATLDVTYGASGKGMTDDSGAYVEKPNGNTGTINVNNATLKLNGTTAFDNSGTITVTGESTLNVTTLSDKSTIDLMDGAIIKDSTVGGGVFVAGNVTFRGDNTLGMITDFGTLTDYYGTTAPMAWTVEAGASVTLTNTARYGLGYGDKVVVNGEIAANGAAAARATLTDDDATNDVKQSLFMHGLVAQESAGWNCDSSFTVNNAFVTIGSNDSFGSKAGNYGGNYTFSFNNSVLNASRITFYNTNAKTTFTLTGSDVEIGQFMTRDQDSVFTLDNTKLYSTSTINGNDEGQYNAGTLNVFNGSTLTYTSAMTNEATGVINVDNATFVAPEVENSNEFNVSGESTIKAVVSGNGWIYMSDALLDENTTLIGANVRFASGENVVDGAVIKDGRFQVGTGLYQAVDPVVDSENGVTVTVKNNAQIGGIDTSDTGAPYGGWIGSAYYDSFEDKQAAMTDARYTLNIENSIANFGYMHVSHDGILNVTGNADEKASYTGVDYSFYSGFFNVNGVATFDDVDVLTLFVNVSSDNDTENPGKLVIKNGTNFVSWRDSITTAETFKISKTGVVEVDNATLDARHNTLIAEDASLIVKNGGTVTANSGAFSSITNNGTISVTDSTLNAYTLTNNGVFTIGTVYDDTVTNDVASTNIIKIGEFTGKITLTDEAIIAETSSIKTTQGGEIYVEDDATLYWGTVTGANITVFDDLAFEGVDFSSDTVTIYDGKFSWDAKGNSADQELIINGATVVWDKGAATVVDAETGDVYNVVINETGITATYNADAQYDELVLAYKGYTQGEADYTVTVDAEATAGKPEYTWNFTATTADDKALALSADGMTLTFTDFANVATNGEVKLTITVTDAYGQTKTTTETITLADKTAPTLELSADQNAWAKDQITINLNSTENFAAAVTYEYFNGSDWEKLDGATYDATINGTYKFRAVDAAGNVSAEETIEIEKIDKTPASLTIVGNVKDWTNGDVTLEADVQDEGAVTTQFSTDGATWTDGSTVTVKENTDVTFKVTDRAGNVTEKTVTVDNIDKTQIAITVDTDYVDGWSNQDVVLTVSANETPSTTVLKATVDGAEAGLTNGTLTFDQDGTYEVSFSASNSAGTTAETSKTIKIDKTAPVVNAEFELKGSDIVVRWTAEDANIDSLTLTLNGEKVKDVIGLEGSKTFTDVDGSNVFEFIATDLAGNETKVTKSIEVSAGISGGAGDSEGEKTPNKNITVNNKTTDQELGELENSYIVLDEGKSNISVQGGKSDEVKEVTIQGVGKKDGDVDDVNNVNNVKVGSNTALIVKDNISNLGNVNVGNNAKLHIMTENKGGILEGTEANQTIKTGKNSEIAVHGNWEFNGGNNTIKTGNKSILTADDVNMREGNDKITVGKDAAVNAGVLNLDKGKNQINVGNDADWVSKDVKSLDGNDTFKLNKDADAIIQGAVDMGEGKNKINLGNDGDWESQSVTFGDDNDTFQIGSHADAHVYGDLELGNGNNTIKIGKDSELEVVSTEEKPGDVNFGSGKDSFQIGADTDIDVWGDVTMGAGNDTFKVGSDSQVIIAGALNLGEGKDTVTLQKKAVLEVGSIDGFEVFNASKGAELWTNAQVNFDNVKGSWKNLEIIHNITNADALTDGSVYGNESDIYTFGKDTEISGIDGLLDNGLRVEYSTDGIIWSSIDQNVATFAEGSSIKISSTNDYNVKKEYSLAIG